MRQAIAGRPGRQGLRCQESLVRLGGAEERQFGSILLGSGRGCS